MKSNATKLTKNIFGWLINKFDNGDVSDLRETHGTVGEMTESELIDGKGNYFAKMMTIELGDRVIEITVKDNQK